MRDAQPLIAQLVPRQWVEGAGWMYTQKDLEYAVELADRLRKEHQSRRSLQQDSETGKPGVRSSGVGMRG